jgi:hypothetical protein
MPVPDYNATRDERRAETLRYLDGLVGEGCGANVSFHWQTYPDKDPANNRDLVATFEGRFLDLADQLDALNARGAAVCVGINEVRVGAPRTNANVIRLRAVWLEEDHAPADMVERVWPQGMAPSMIVSTSGGKAHYYWPIAIEPNGEQALDWWSKWHGIMRHMVRHRGSDPNAAKLSQVLRVPGFWHHKGEPYLVRLSHYQTGSFRFDWLANAFPAPVVELPPPAPLSTPESPMSDGEFARVVHALYAIDPDESRSNWLRCLFALEATGHPQRRDVGDAWSRRGGKYVEGEPERIMAGASLNRDRVARPATIIHLSGELQRESRERGLAMLGGGRSESHTFVDTSYTGPPQRRPMLMPGLVPLGTSFVISGPGGVGKTTHAAAFAAAVACGYPFLALDNIHALANPPPPLNVLFCDFGESYAPELQSDFLAALALPLRRMSASPLAAKLAGERIRIWSMEEGTLPLMTRRNGEWTINGNAFDLLRAGFTTARDAAPANPFGLVLLDNLASLMSGFENDAGAVGLAFEELRRTLREVFGPMVTTGWLAHPSRTGDGAVRGSSVIETKARSVFMLLNPARLTTKSAESKAAMEAMGGIPQDQWRHYRVLVPYKGNFRPRHLDCIVTRLEGDAVVAVPVTERAVAPTHEGLRVARNAALAEWMASANRLMGSGMNGWSMRYFARDCRFTVRGIDIDGLPRTAKERIFIELIEDGVLVPISGTHSRAQLYSVNPNYHPPSRNAIEELV